MLNWQSLDQDHLSHEAIETKKEIHRRANSWTFLAKSCSRDLPDRKKVEFFSLSFFVRRRGFGGSEKTIRDQPNMGDFSVKFRIGRRGLLERVFFKNWPFSRDSREIPPVKRPSLSGLPNANAKSQRFSNAISQIATLPPVVALNRNSKSQIAARYAAFWHAVSQKSHWPLSFSDPKSQRFKPQRLQDANAF